MFGLQPTHLILILVVALLVFGPSRLPEIGKAFGQTLREFQNSTKEITHSIEVEVQKPAEEPKSKPAEAVQSSEAKKEEPPTAS